MRETETIARVLGHGFLHDPPHKPLVLGKGHEQIGFTLARDLFGEVDEKTRRVIHLADRFAAGADRAEWLRDLETDPVRDLVLIHPMSGRSLEFRGRDGETVQTLTLTPEDVSFARDLVEGPETDPGIRDVRQSVWHRWLTPEQIPDGEWRFWALWRFGLDTLRTAERSHPDGKRHALGRLWEVLPADTRMPHHGLFGHQSLTATLAAILAAGRRPALMRMAVGPVQPFIEAARSLADLWAGSEILARTIFEVVQEVALHWGPQAIVFPSVHGHWMLDEVFWSGLGKVVGQNASLLQEFRRLERGAEDRAEKRRRFRERAIPSLPNVCLAVVAADDGPEPAEGSSALGTRGGEALLRRCEEAVRRFWSQEIRSTLQRLHEDESLSEGDLDRALGQARRHLEVHASLVPWPDPKAGGIEVFSAPEVGWLPSASDRARTWQRIATQEGAYQPNAGTTYPLLAEATAILLDAVKRERLGPGEEAEQGLKCSLCGEREVLGSGSFVQQKAFWREWSAPWKRSGEALCGVCLWKRLVGRSPLGEGQERLRHPSTLEVAITPYKVSVCRRSRAGDEKARELRRTIERLAEVLENETWDERVFVPEQVIREAGDDEALRRFVWLDGEAFFQSIAGGRGAVDDDVPTDPEFSFPEPILWALREVRNAARKAGVPDPRPYLAVVVFDGDQMGQWINGTHPETPSLWEMVHPRARQSLSEASRGLLESISRPMTASLHGFLSRICADFAQRTVPSVIRNGGGHLVYAGGDDALWLSAPREAVELAWNLRKAFSGSLRDPGDEGAGSGRPYRLDPEAETEWYAAFGPRMSASAGMCVFHTRTPLGAALEEARRMEQEAKRQGGDRVGIAVLRRSGQTSRAVLRFGEEVRCALDLAQWFQGAEVSRSLAARLLQEFASFRGDQDPVRERGLVDVAEAFAKRVVWRRELHEQNTEDASKERERLWGLVRGLRPWNDNDLEGPWDLREWCERLSVAEFLGRASERQG